MSDLKRYFKNLFSDSRQKNLSILLRKRILLQCEMLQNKDFAKQQEIHDLELQILTFDNPMQFNEKHNEEIIYEKNFENLMLYLSQELKQDISNKTVFSFYTAFELIKQQKNAERKQLKK